MFATFRNSSRKSGNKNKSILKTYIDFYIGKSNVSHIENKAKYIDVKDFVFTAIQKSQQCDVLEPHCA